MLNTATHDYRVSKVFAIAIGMSAIAGFINSIMLIEFGLPVSQMTGIASHLSDSGFHFDWKPFMISLSILLSFIVGAFLSGFIIGHSQYKEDKSYGVALFLNAVILTVAGVMAYSVNLLALMFSALACGLQNAMVASYKGLQIRTTHVTGITTDIGVSIAHRFRTRTPLTWKNWLLFAILLGFILGGLIGIFSFQWFGYLSLLLPAALNALLAWIYFHSLIRKRSPS
ncbi:hypothetical protein AVO42_07310 [Thiomicrospira sp. XS5]|uniref:YoaK family protein n=1 Tax=Thiomicrospira sp. XS5 TaxID=1775636 RepID=UPI000748C828|nr:YoaK family protein [Thiomicrospira sp. XS5]KUJ75151.1 hypothetical protein AVO42_07310 [Thiomicrospira sp. XS5]